jgi:hypothetical protein
MLVLQTLFAEIVGEVAMAARGRGARATSALSVGHADASAAIELRAPVDQQGAATCAVAARQLVPRSASARSHDPCFWQRGAAPTSTDDPRVTQRRAAALTRHASFRRPDACRERVSIVNATPEQRGDHQTYEPDR